MKLITWNCQGAFRNKAQLILKHKPDIVVVPECEHPDKLNFKPEMLLPTDNIWVGTNPNKGLGVFSYSNFKLSLLDAHNPAFRNILPIAVSSAHISFILFAIWANNPHDPDGNYITQIWKALHHYEALLNKKGIVMIGDFNSNAIWDRPTRLGNHSTVVERLAHKSIYSTYHLYHNQKQGAEKHPTFFLYRNQTKSYHLDYCFASIDFINKLKSVEIGAYRKWRNHSDHVPLTVTFQP